MSSQALYVPYKAVGYVTDGNPFVVNRLGNETFINVTIGRSFQVNGDMLSKLYYLINTR